MNKCHKVLVIVGGGLKKTETTKLSNCAVQIGVIVFSDDHNTKNLSWKLRFEMQYHRNVCSLKKQKQTLTVWL